MKKLLLLITCIAMLGLTACSSGSKNMALVDGGVSISERKERPMRILIINDDGYDALGAQMLYSELEKRGNEVWIVAPRDNQSGSGTSIKWNKAPHELIKYGEKRYAFEGSPSDCFKVAVNVVMEEKPDLVISGVNDGPNFGEIQFNSGTVGGAARAVRHGYPAIAASLTLYRSNEDRLPEYMEPAVDYVADIVDKLSAEWKKGKMMMPQGTGISINYPGEYLNGDEMPVHGVKFIENEDIYTDFQNYAYKKDGKIYNSMNNKMNEMLADENVVSDLTEANRGYVTVTVIDGNWNAEETKVKYMETMLEDIQP